MTLSGYDEMKQIYDTLWLVAVRLVEICTEEILRSRGHLVSGLTIWSDDEGRAFRVGFSVSGAGGWFGGRRFR